LHLPQIGLTTRRKFLDLDQREDKNGLEPLKAGRPVHPDHDNRDDPEGVRLAPGQLERGPLHVGDVDHRAGILVVRLRVDRADRYLRVAVEELHIALHLLLRVTDQDGPGLDLMGARWRVDERKQHCKAQSGLHGNLLNGETFSPGLVLARLHGGEMVFPFVPAAGGPRGGKLTKESGRRR
jgi:hypothetical protein